MTGLKRVPAVFWQIALVVAGVAAVAVGVCVLAGWPWALIGVGAVSVAFGLLVDV